MKKLSHYDDAGQARMVDVSAKAETRRTAAARAFVRMSRATLKALPDNPKGNPLEVARVAGIQGAKKTSELIPMCHPLMLTHSDVEITVKRDGVLIEATAATTAQTGVEMEALTAASIAALTVYDMTKALDKGISIERIEIGGKDRRKERNVAPDRESRPRPEWCWKTGIAATGWKLRTSKNVPLRCAVLTISDSTYAGVRQDASGPAVAARLAQAGHAVVLEAALPDEREQIAAKLRAIAAAAECDAVFTTGGTGLSARDVTPEATRSVIEREIPGLGELMRSEGLRSTRRAALSRATAGTLGRTVIVNLPGSPKGAMESLNAILELVPHVVELLQGRTEHPPSEAPAAKPERV